MRVDLRTLEPNPYRDLTVDPIDETAVDDLALSMKDDGFWGGIVCRQVGSVVQIGAGHHRVAAAIKTGIYEADVFVGEFDDPGMIRIYARENATQRGNSGTALAGTIAGCIKFIAKQALTGTLSTFLEKVSEEDIRGNLTSDRGLGEPVILQFLPNIPGITLYTVRQQLASLKASGDYARFIAEVEAEIEQEEREIAEALARAEAARRESETQDLKERLQQKRKSATTARQARTKAQERKITFDYEGVSRHLKNPNQQAVFREVVTGQGVAPLLPVNQQAALAAQLVTEAEKYNREVSGAFIREHVIDLVINAKAQVRKEDDKELERARQENLQLRARQYMDDFSRSLRGLNAAGVKLLDLEQQNPGVEIIFSQEFLLAVKNVQDISEKLGKLVTRLRKRD